LHETHSILQLKLQSLKVGAVHGLVFFWSLPD
jgi:hypothetical protein